MNGFLISIITVLGGVITAWISSTVVWKQKEIGIIDRLSYELESGKESPFITEACISRLFRCRPIQHSVLQRLLRMNYSVEILAITAIHRRILEIYCFHELNGRVYIKFRGPFSTQLKRFFAGFLCFSLMIFFSIIASERIAILLIDIYEENIIGVISDSIYIFVFLIFSYVFTWHLYVISTAKTRLIKTKMLLLKNYKNDNYKNNGVQY